MKFFALLILWGTSAAAFMNIEAIRQIPGEGFIGNSGLQFSGQEGNTNKTSSRVSTLGVFRWPDDEFLYTADYRYGSTSWVKDTNAGNAHIRYTFWHREPTAYEVFAQSEFDEFKDLNSRNLAGGNIRQRVADNGIHNLYVGVGSFYESENFSGADDKEGLRGNIYLSYVYKQNEILTASVTSYYQPRWQDPSEHRLRLQTGIDVRLSKWLSMDVDFNLTHDNRLPKDVKPTDMDYLVGFSVSY